MATIDEIIEARTVAGQAYASAVDGLRSAYISLKAHDIALGNANLPTPIELDLRSFGTSPSQSFPNPLEHPVFAADRLAKWDEDAQAMATQIINSYAG